MITNDPNRNIISKLLSRKQFGVYIHAKSQHEVHKLHKKRAVDNVPITGRVDTNANFARQIKSVPGKFLYSAVTVNVKFSTDKKSTAIALCEQYNIRHGSKDISLWLFDFYASHKALYENPPIIFDFMITDFSS